MKTKLTALLTACLSLTTLAACKHDSCDCEKPKAVAATPAATHPLKGIIVDILSDRSALLVKHEAIPGFMAAMTMLFKVDAATLAAAKKGDAITGQLSRKDDDWILTDVKAAATP